MQDGDDESRSLLDPVILQQLLVQLEQTDVDELEVVFGSARLYLRREPGRRGKVREAITSHTPPPGIPILAPLTGVFWSRSTPADPPYIELGKSISAGQVVGLLETMKLFNEVVAEVSGEVIDVKVRDGDLIEAGAVLMYVRLSEGDAA